MQVVRPEKEAMALRIEGLEGEVRHWQAEYHTKVCTVVNRVNTV